MIVIGNGYTVQWFSGMAWPPADYGASDIVLIEDIPDGFAFAREIGDRLDALSTGRRFSKTVDAVFEGALTGGNGCPQHR